MMQHMASREFDQTAFQTNDDGSEWICVPVTHALAPWDLLRLVADDWQAAHELADGEAGR